MVIESEEKSLGLKEKEYILLTKGELHSQIVNTTDGFLRIIDIKCVIPYECDLPERSMIEIYLRKVK